MREMIAEAHRGIIGRRDAVAATNLSNTTLGTEAAMMLSRAEAAYGALRELPDAALQHQAVLVEIARFLEAAVQSVHPLIKQLDDYRFQLDHQYGN